MPVHNDVNTTHILQLQLQANGKFEVYLSANIIGYFEPVTTDNVNYDTYYFINLGKIAPKQIDNINELLCIMRKNDWNLSTAIQYFKTSNGLSTTNPINNQVEMQKYYDKSGICPLSIFWMIVIMSIYSHLIQ